MPGRNHTTLSNGELLTEHFQSTTFCDKLDYFVSRKIPLLHCILLGEQPISAGNYSEPAGAALGTSAAAPEFCVFQRLSQPTESAKDILISLKFSHGVL